MFLGSQNSNQGSKKKKIYQNLTAEPLSRFPRSWVGQKCPKNVLSLPAPRFRFAPRFQDEIVSLKKRLFYMVFNLFLPIFLQFHPFNAHMKQICKKIRFGLHFWAAMEAQTFWYGPGRVATAYSTDKYKYQRMKKVEWGNLLVLTLPDIQ